MAVNEPIEPPEIPEELRDQMREKAERLEAAAHKIGLHAQEMSIAVAIDPETGQPESLVLATNFLVGDLAFSERVQHPEHDDMNDEIARLEQNLTISSFEDLRNRFKSKDDHGTTEGTS